MDSGKKSFDRCPNPLYKANFFSKITLAWTLQTFKKGLKRDLELNDLFKPLKEHRSSILGDAIEINWNKEIERAAEQRRKPSLFRVLCRTFGLQLFLLGLILAFTDITLKVLQPLFLARFLSYYDTGSALTKLDAYLYASGVILCSVLQTIILQPYWLSMYKLGMKIRVSCCSLLYRKALRLSKTALGQTTVGQIVNLISNDVARLDMCVLLVNYLWIGPLLTIFITYFLWLHIGLSAVIGVIALLLFIPVLMWLGKEKSVYRLRTAKRTDDRIFLMNEIINGIQVIKMYSWEKPFINLVSQVRKLEINQIRHSSYIEGVMLSLLVFHSRFSMFCSIVSYIALGNVISASVVYAVSSYFSMLRTVMSDLFPYAVSSTAEALMSVVRLDEFMNYNESSMEEIQYQPSYKNFAFVNSTDLIENYRKTQRDMNIDSQQQYQSKPCIVVMKDVTAKWREDTAENTLNNVNINFKCGELAVIIGPVGCGKSSLLNVILQELPLKNGDINIQGVVSYASQEPWIFGESVRQNIIFDSPFDKVRYKQVVTACALNTDFKQFPFGDQTIVGDRGVILSGGQRARINLARAVYKKADIYLLDDPLSAVDTAVGKHLFEECINGYLQGKTCILVTHQLQYLTSVNHIVVLENGTVRAEGSYQKLQSAEENFLTHLGNSNQELEGEEKNKYKHQHSESTIGSITNDDEQEQVEETRHRGKLRGSVLKTYLLSGGHWCVIVFVLFTFVLTQLVANAGDYWLNYWTNLQEYVYHINSTATDVSPVYFPIIFDQSTFIIGFSVFIFSTIIISLLRSVLFFNICLRSSSRLHNNLFTSITRTAMRFFSTNPAGRILNRFTKDIGSVDETIPGLLFEVLQIALDIVGVVCIAMIVNIWLIVPTTIIVGVLYVLRQFYMKTSQSVKRLEGIARSPVVSHLNASLQGLTTIRAFKSEPILQQEFDTHQDLHTSAWFLMIATRRAFGYCTDVICLVFVAVVTMSFLILDKTWLGGDVGLAITQSITITSFFQWAMKQSAELESNLTSVERVVEYCELEKEPPLESTPDKKPAESWPEEGRIEFLDLSLAYSPELPLVLKNLNFIVQPKEKVGIVGRTGAGKSSLITALFRLAEIEGHLIIDGVDIHKIGLQDLRSKLSIIPQEPVLFSGSIRMNLDPFNEYPDEILWNALEEVQLKDIVKDVDGGLTCSVTEGGGNFSVGQRQLICLARAIIRNNKILVLDEATANVDHQTDALIQRTMRVKFSDCTVLTIAHRLHTVMDANKILVMDNGSMVEYDHPYKLLSNKDSYLYKMVAQTGKTTAQTLHDMASMNYNSLVNSL